MLPHSKLLVLLCSLFLSLALASNSEVSDSSISYLLPLDIIDDIQAYRFAKADQKILQTGISPPIARQIVKVIYHNSLNNFDLLIKYAKASSQDQVRIIVLSGLWQAMNQSAHINVNNLIALHKTIYTTLIVREQTSNEIKTEASKLRNSVGDAIIMSASEEIAAAVLNGSYHNSTSILELNAALLDLSEYLSDEVIYAAVDRVHGQMPYDEIIRNMYNTITVAQTVAAMVHIYEEIEPDQNLNGTATLVLADYLARLQDMPNYLILSERKKEDFSNLIGQLPKSIRNLYFGQKVCIKNAGYGEYMYTPSGYFHSTNRRYTFTWGEKTVDDQMFWLPKKYEGRQSTFEFVSTYQENEYLYMPAVEEFDHFYRHVMTWTVGGSLGQTSAWEIELNVDGVLIRNLLFDWYLCVSTHMHSNNRRLVFTRRNDWLVKILPECKWLIETCEVAGQP